MRPLPSSVIAAPLTAPRPGAIGEAGKRAFDVLVASALLLIALPLMLLAAAAVALDSPGPVLFVQERWGQGMRRFRVLKLRSMVPTASGAPRITRVGRVLRRTSIDELPQLLNVLTGSMSLVGPRPFVVRESLRAAQLGPARFEVRPGLTGLAQVSGRNALSLRQKVRLDEAYVRSWSPWLDLEILLQTPAAVITGEARLPAALTSPSAPR
jgi:lipopolysaccharide/colanic/teichoic acid biosynthesis glycosyltransferase